MRIVSLVPSLTETLCSLQLEDYVVGCTSFCVCPPDIHRQALLVGGTKDPDLEKITSLKPTHILVNTEENRTVDILGLKKIFADTATQVIEFFPRKIEDVEKMIDDLGKIFGRQALANEKTNQIQIIAAELLKRHKQVLKPKTFLYFIWKKPYMVAGKNTFISNLLESAGLSNLINTPAYPTLTTKEWSSHPSADLIFFSTEPYPFKKRDLQDFQNDFPDCRSELLKADGRLCSWHGNLTIEALTELQKYQHHLPNKIFRSFI